jgi:CheY-like chemotaxis protein
MPRTVFGESHKHHSRHPARLTCSRPLVLLASDDTPAMSLAARTLRGAGYEVRPVHLGARAVESLRRSGKPRLPGDAIELVLLDATSRPWIALALLDALRSVDSCTPVIVLADSSPSTREEANRLGVEAVIESPLDAAELLRTVETLAPPIPSFDLELGDRESVRH